jgi:transposase
MVIHRWSATRKREAVLRLLRGQWLDAVSWEIGVEVYRMKRWRQGAGSKDVA